MQKWYFVSKIILIYCEKKIIEFIRTICSNSERSEQFLNTLFGEKTSNKARSH